MYKRLQIRIYPNKNQEVLIIGETIPNLQEDFRSRVLKNRPNIPRSLTRRDSTH